MIFVKDNAVTVYGFFTASGLGATGLTVTFTCYEGTSGTAVVNAQSATELAGGFYYYTITSGTVDANAGYVYKFITAGTADQKEIPGQFITGGIANSIASILEDTGTTLDTKLNTIDDFLDTEIAAIKAKTDNLPAAPATEAKQDTIIGYLDTEMAAVLAAVDTEVAAIKAKTDNLPAAPAATGDIPTAGAIADAVWDEPTSGHTGAGTAGAALIAAGSAGDPWATELPGSYTGTQAGKVVADVLADTAELQTNQGNWLTATGFSTHSAADVWAVSVRTLSSFGTLVADVWGYVTRALTDKAGFTISGTKTTLDGLNDLSAAQVNAEVDTALADYDAPTKAELDSAVSPLATSAALATVDGIVDAIKLVTDKVDTTLVADGLVSQFTANALELAPTAGSAPTAAAIADAVWDEATAGHTTTGTTGAAIIAAGSAGDPWSTALPGDYVAGTAGYKIANIDNAVTSSNAVVIAAGDASKLNLRIADTYSQAFTSLGTVTGYTKIWFTIKTDRNHADSEALVQIDTTTGLVTLNGATGTSANGSITVSDASAGNMTVLLDESETAKLNERSMCYYNIKALVSGVATTLAEGRIDILNSTTKTVS